MSKEVDKRMQWILRLEELENNSLGMMVIDYEICSEVRISGVFEYANKNIICYIFAENKNDINGLYTYLVRIKLARKEFVFDKSKYKSEETKKKKDEGYYFPGGFIGELIAIFSVYFQARFFLKSKTRYSDDFPNYPRKEYVNFKYWGIPDEEIYYEMFTEQERNWAKDGLKNFLDDIQKIPQNYHQSLIRSLHWYSEAIKNIGVDHELFYIKVVSCIEAIIAHEDFQIKDNLNEKMNEIICDEDFNKKEKQEIKSWLKHRKTQKRFIEFIKEYSSEFFPEDDSREPEFVYINENGLELYLKKIYDARSKYLHVGRPMYISGDHNSDNLSKNLDWDLDPFQEELKLPRPRFFERLVNHCLKNFVKKKSNK